jgi:hypothetical protein
MEKAKNGGARPGAGRPKGAKNKKTLALAAEIAQSGLTPLKFMLGVMRNPKRPLDIRLDAAKAAAPYVHAKLSSVELTGKDGEPIETVTRVELVPMKGNGNSTH